MPNYPEHVAIIMDGNGRWAKKRGLPRLAGHKAGVDNLRRVVSACVDFGVKVLTVYAFSTENWNRPKAEVDGLMNILETVIDNELRDLHAQGVQVRHIGDLQKLSPALQKKVRDGVTLTENNTKLTLNIAFNYGGRDEILHAIRELMKENVKAEDLTAEMISNHLYTAGLPDPDLVIRTSGEFRISNFLIWQSAYSEWYVTDTFWPDFNKEQFKIALDAYADRDRRFGKIQSDEYEDKNA